MTEIPRRTVARTARLAGIPLAWAGRNAVGIGRRVGGAPADAVAAAVAERTADQLFTVLGQLKGGAMKVGQAMSIFEAAMPEDIARGYRGALTALQDSAPSMPAATVHHVLDEELGHDWRTRLIHLGDNAVASASIGQVHRGTWHDGRSVAVKVQYPGAADALLSDLRMLTRVSRFSGSMRTGIDVRRVADELQRRMGEELDYEREASAQRRFAAAFIDSEAFAVPDVVCSTPRVIVMEWLEGVPLSSIIASGTQTERDHAATAYLDLLLAGPDHARLLHADPHPGNFRVTSDGRLGVMDFGAVDELPDGMPPAVGRLLGLALSGSDSADTVAHGLREEGWIRRDADVDPEQLLEFLDPFLEPARHERYRFTREWLRACFAHIADPRWQPVIRALDLPPEYLLIHRVWAGGIGVLCQLGGDVEVRGILEHWLDDLHLG